jgi:hypothetical protein
MSVFNAVTDQAEFSPFTLVTARIELAEKKKQTNRPGCRGFGPTGFPRLRPM